MDGYKKILSEIIRGKSQWSDLKNELSNYNLDDRVLKQKEHKAVKCLNINYQNQLL